VVCVEGSLCPGQFCFTHNKHLVFISKKLLGRNMTGFFTVQDAHEFLNFLLNELVDILEKESRAAKSNSGNQAPLEKVPNGSLNGMANGNHHKEPVVTWVHKIFQVN
jgi:hypothetical protein